MLQYYIFQNFIDIILAVFIDFLIGDPYGFPHPIIYIGKFISFLEKRFRKISKSNNSLKYFGGAIVLIVAFVSFIVPFIILKFSMINFYLYHVVNIIIIWTTLSAKCLAKEALKVYYALKEKDIEKARLKLSYIVGRDTTRLREDEIIRADVETVAENTSDGIIAPLFHAILGGAPLAMMYKGINTMDSMLGYLTVKYKDIGFFPAKVDDIFNFIPARITGILMCLVSPITSGNIFTSFKIMIRDRKNHKSPNCGYPESATAGALNIELGGTNVYFGEIIEKPTIGDRKKELNKIHIKESIKVLYASEILMLIFYGVAMFVYYRLMN